MLSATDRVEVEFRLDRAREFLALAELARDDPDYANSIVSLCAISGIASSDAVLLAAGQTRAARAGHEQAPGDLRSIAQDQMAASLSRLLRLKPKAQYSAGQTCTVVDANKALRDAARILELARAYCEKRMTT